MAYLEVCASTIRDVAVALEAGAHRVELCSVWSAGGITPNVVVVEAAVAMGMPVRALIRPREGSFMYSKSERSWAVEEAKIMLDCGAARVVVGGLNEEGCLDEAYLEAMVEAVGSEALVWHRAIDASQNSQADVQLLLDFAVQEVLSSGGALRAVDGICQLQNMIDAGLRVIAGGGVQPEDVAALEEAGVHAVHASCRTPSQEGHSQLFDTTVYLVDYDKVLNFIELLNN